MNKFTYFLHSFSIRLLMATRPSAKLRIFGEVTELSPDTFLCSLVYLERKVYSLEFGEFNDLIIGIVV